MVPVLVSLLVHSIIFPYAAVAYDSSFLTNMDRLRRVNNYYELVNLQLRRLEFDLQSRSPKDCSFDIDLQAFTVIDIERAPQAIAMKYGKSLISSSAKLVQACAGSSSASSILARLGRSNRLVQPYVKWIQSNSYKSFGEEVEAQIVASVYDRLHTSDVYRPIVGLLKQIATVTAVKRPRDFRLVHMLHIIKGLN